jgi:N-acetylglucosamine-6-phosphate deacetylase
LEQDAVTEYWFAGAVLTPEGRIDDAFVRVTDGVIDDIGRRSRVSESEAAIHRLDGCTLVPGFVDTHIHGGGGADVMDATPEALETIGRYLLRHGVTSWLPTTITNSMERLTGALANVKTAMRGPTRPRPEILGAHLEGPYINAKMKGAQPGEFIRPIDVDECLRLCDDVVKTVTLAPELPHGMDLISALARAGINASAGHTEATFAQMVEAVENGLVAVTHGFNAQRGLHHREPGVIGAAMAIAPLRVELIADLIHVHPGAVTVLRRAKGDRHIVLISDSMRAAGQPDGDYDLGGQTATVCNGRATLADGALAGSITNLADEVKNLVREVDIPLESAVRMASSNPADSVGAGDRKGRLAPGYDADMVALDGDLAVRQTILRGAAAL